MRELETRGLGHLLGGGRANVATSHRIYARIKLDAGVAAGLDLTEHMKRLEAVAAAAQRWAEKFQSDVPEAVAVREALAELAERGGE